MTNEQKIYPLTICGAGPAGLGAIIQSAKMGLLSNLLEDGVAVIENSNKIGGGSLTKYDINSNTLAKVLLEAFDTVDSRCLFLEYMDKNNINNISNIKDHYIPCREMGLFLNELGEAVSSIFNKYKNSHIIRNSKLESINLKSDGSQEIIYSSSGKSKSIKSLNTILTLGAEQPLDSLKKKFITGNIQLEKYESKVIPSSYILKKDNTARQLILKKLNVKHPRIVILGGSHSAWSVAWFVINRFKSWLNKTINLNPASIIIAHRSNIKLFYNSADEALSDNYVFNQNTDICSLSGRVNRFGGLRGDAFDLAKECIISGEGGSLVNLVSLTNSSEKRIEAILDAADIIIPAFGYRARTVPIFDNTGNFIPLKFDSTGLVIDEHTRILKEDGGVLNNILAYGLGAGMRTSQKVGGESALSGRVDGIWLFQNDVGRVAINTLLKNLKKNQLKEGCK